MEVESPHDVKVYQINRGFYEFRNLNSSSGIIHHIINYHVEHSLRQIDYDGNLPEYQKDNIKYSLYVYNEVEYVSPWKVYLPAEITEDNDFNVKASSFVLFAELEDRIFCIVGGRGISAIKRFINYSFGLELYEKFSNPTTDIVYTLFSRSLSGNLTSQFSTFKEQQILIDALSLGRIPIKILIGINQEGFLEIFNFLPLTENTEQFIEIGNSFWLKNKLTFDETHQLLQIVGDLLQRPSNNRISRFEEVKDQEFCDNSLIPGLSTNIFDDSQRVASGSHAQLDFDFVHPQKLLMFYECDSFQAFYKKGKVPMYSTNNRNEIYQGVLTKIRNDHGSINQFDFNGILWGIQIKGFKGGNEVTKAPFITHINCEYKINQTSYFFLDNRWYQAKGDFIDTINSESKQILKAKFWENNPLALSWNSSQTEGVYNLSYLNQQGFIVLDRMLGQNIELCDLLYETDTTIYLIHVKAGFDAKLRELTNQILISSSRLSNDLTTNKDFVREVFQSFQNSPNNIHSFDEERFLNLFEKNIEFVLAFCPKGVRNDVINNIEAFTSNVAKFSIISVSREMATNSYPLKIVELSS
ncbi:DUF6119 family protein [Algoriphagus marinus]|uniref:DUF6119 family protein n=1 Tax=Algoriphagus marinus TaxID=1925762 RepID=UPI00094B99E8|nr:DUF6119 family protein [Algoriphagus marinus]